MKKMFLAFAAVLCALTLTVAQEDGAKLAKKAAKSYSTYNIDPSGNAGKLTDAKEEITRALATPEAQASVSAWQSKGDIYSTIAQKEMLKFSLDKSASFSGDNDALEAYNAYVKALELSTKKYEKSDALKGIMDLQDNLNNVGIIKYEKKEYGKAYESFNAYLKSHEVLKANGKESKLDDKKVDINEQIYITALCALLSKKNAEAIALLDPLVKKGTAKEEVYEALLQAKTDTGDEAGAAALLIEGRQKFPGNMNMLIAEINNLIKAGKLDELIDRLKQAIEKEPANASLYVNLGRVYDDLQNREIKAGNTAKAQEYFDLAKQNYTLCSEKDPNSIDGYYQIGQMYYNRAVAVSQKMNTLGNTSEDLKKYKTMNTEMLGYFDQALPYFQKAEAVDPNDLNTLVALTEIYARKEDDLSLEFKKRKTVVQEGGKNAGSYFKK
jgi:tetratricopeptide (TPR) repeat protein